VENDYDDLINTLHLMRRAWRRESDRQSPVGVRG